jgi:hypothetical protein
MKPQQLAIHLCAVSLLSASVAQKPSSENLSSLVGDWTGTSLCRIKPSGCHDETVVYRLSNPRRDKITVQADKIVDGKTITMGVSEWTYDSSAHSLTWSMPRRTWKLVQSAQILEGTLTEPDGTVFRKVRLRKSK